MQKIENCRGKRSTSKKNIVLLPNDILMNTLVVVQRHVFLISKPCFSVFLVDVGSVRNLITCFFIYFILDILFLIEMQLLVPSWFSESLKWLNSLIHGSFENGSCLLRQIA